MNVTMRHRGVDEPKREPTRRRHAYKSPRAADPARSVTTSTLLYRTPIDRYIVELHLSSLLSPPSPIQDISKKAQKVNKTYP